MTENKSDQKNNLSATFLWLAVIFCICLVSSNIFVPRLWKVWGLSLELNGGVIIFPISYIINDCLTEVYGYRKARLVNWMGFAMASFFALFSWIATILPSPMDPTAVPIAENFNSLFAMVPRTTIASLVAFICGSTANAIVMSKMKVASKGKGFGFRAILSSVAGESLDSIIFFPIALGGIIGFNSLVNLIIMQVVVKTLYELIILPVTAKVVRILKEEEGIDAYDENISYNPFKLSDI